ncbi:MAG: phosphonate C-P lyase system protein PhnH [Burkholderiaceae bacterium]|nr:phosphonate C-P lyase system protein PhnH [Burkholderiaceae bacterium]
MPAMHELPLGLLDPVDDAQAVFRAALRALSCRVSRSRARRCAAVTGLMPATAALLLALTDQETAVWWNSDGPSGWLRFHTGAPAARVPGQAQFGVIRAAGPFEAFARFNTGSDAQPERSATLLIELPALTGGPAVEWSGPGLRAPTLRRLAGLPADFWRQWSDNHAMFPSGVDVLFICGSDIVGLPRTTRAIEREAG